MAETVTDLIRILKEDNEEKARKERTADRKREAAEKKSDQKYKRDLDDINKKNKALLDKEEQIKKNQKLDAEERKAQLAEIREQQKRNREDREVMIADQRRTRAERKEDIEEKKKQKKEADKISKEKKDLDLKKAAVEKKVADMEQQGLDASKDADITQSRIELLKEETELKNQGLDELQQRRNNQEANRKILEMEGRNADFNKKFQKEERKLQRAELKDRLGKATSGAERKELLKEQAAKDKKSLSVFQNIELGVRNLGESFAEKFKGMASAGMGFLKKGALIALLFLLPKILNSEAAKNLVKLIQDKVIPFFKRMSEFFEGIFGEGTGGLVATLTAVGAILYGPTIIKLLFKAAKGLVGAVMSLLSDSTTALGTDTKGKGKGKFSRLGRGLSKLFKGGGKLAVGVGKGAVGLAKGATGAATTVGKGIVSGAKSAGNIISKTGPAAASKAASVIGSGAKLAAGAAKFAGPVGLAITGALAVTDGLKAGMEEFKKSGKLGKAVQEGLAGAASGLTFGLISQETISGGMSKVGEAISDSALGRLFKKKKNPYEGMDDYDKMQAGIDKRDELAMNKSELLRFEQDPAAYAREVNKGNTSRRKIQPQQIRKQLLANIDKNKESLEQLGEFGVGAGGSTETAGAMMRADLKELKTTGMTAAQIIAQGKSDRERDVKDVAPVIINNDSSVRSSSSNTQNVNETITPRDGMLVAATADF